MNRYYIKHYHRIVRSITISHSITFHKNWVDDHLQWETECDETITYKRKENGVLDGNETKSYGFALLKPLKKHLKGSDTDNPWPINTDERASNV